MLFHGLYVERSSSKKIKAIVETGGCFGLPFLIATDRKKSHGFRELENIIFRIQNEQRREKSSAVKHFAVSWLFLQGKYFVSPFTWYKE